MSETDASKQIIDDLAFLKDKIINIEREINEINDDLHELRPEYSKKLKKIDEGPFLSREDFEKELKD